MVILYAHTDYTVGVKGGRILSTAPPYGQRRFSVLDREMSFILYPSLARELSIEGSVNYKVYLRSSVKRTAHLNITLYEADATDNTKRVSSALIALPVENQINPYVLGIPLKYTFSKDSTIIFSIIAREDVSTLTIFWDEETTDTYVALPIRRGFRAFDLQALDSTEYPIVGANITIIVGDVRVWTGRTDTSGRVIAFLPRSDESLQDIVVRWKDVIVNKTSYRTTEDSKIRLKCEVYNLELFTRDLLGSPVDGSAVIVRRNGSVITEGKTSGEGKVEFPQLPASMYDIETKNNLTVLVIPVTISQNVPIQLTSDVSQEIQLNLLKPWLLSSASTALIILAAASTTVTLLRRRKRSIRKYDFDYFDVLSGGGIPSSSSVMITGLPGSGKTILAISLLIKSLRSGNSCIFITNSDFPANIRRELIAFALNLEEYEKSSKFLFIDCYSASGGQESSEQHKISAVGDLTGLGMQVSACLEKLGQNTDVFLDSLTPLFTMLRDDYIANFVHSVGAKTKGVNGHFFYTLGTGIGKTGLSTIEAASDCVVEIASTEESGDVRRRLRIKKLKKKHVERWIEFTVDADRGIIFRRAMGSKSEN